MNVLHWRFAKFKVPLTDWAHISNTALKGIGRRYRDDVLTLTGDPLGGRCSAFPSYLARVRVQLNHEFIKNDLAPGLR